MSTSSSLSGETETASKSFTQPRSFRLGAHPPNVRVERWVAAGFTISVAAQVFSGNYRIALAMLLGGLVGLLVDVWCQRE